MRITDGETFNAFGFKAGVVQEDGYPIQFTNRFHTKNGL